MNEYLPEGFGYTIENNVEDKEEKVEDTKSNTTSTVLPEGFGYTIENNEPDDIVTQPKQKIVYEDGDTLPSDDLIQKVKEERPTEKLSVKDLETDPQIIEDILQYRQDRFGTEKDVGSKNIFFGNIISTQELTPENIVDDYLDHYRFLRNNFGDGSLEVNWLRGLKQKEQQALNAGDGDLANNYAEQRARALRLYQNAESMAGFFDSKRYENMSTGEMISDIAGAAGATTLAILSDPWTVLTAGTGRVVAGRATGSAMKKAIIAAATSAPLEAGAAASTDLAIQQAEIEMGARDEVDYDRTAKVAGISALTAGTLSAGGTALTARRVDKVSRGGLSKSLKNMQEQQTKAAELKNAELGVQSNIIRENLAKGIEKVYGKEAILRNKSGEISGINSSVIRESDYAGRLKQELDLDIDLIEPSLSFSTFERVAASTGEVIEAARNGTLKFKDDVTGKEIKEFALPLQKNERVSERLLNILTNTSDESLNFTTDILGRYGITQRELSATLFADASWAGKRLRELRTLSDIVGRASRTKTLGEAAEEAEEKAAKTLGETFRRLENIRRLTLVSGIATAVRNNLSQILRSGIEAPVYALESAINPNKRFGVRNTMAQIQHTFYDQKDAATISQFILDMHDKQKSRFYNQYSEVKNTLRKNNPGQSSLAGKGNSVQSTTPFLDKWEGVITSFNYLNRLQEAAYRNGMFSASLQRQLFDKGLDYLDVLKSGRITENISEEMVTKAVDDALEFTYASQPKFAPFRTLNKMIVESGFTLAIPFPRFMFKAMEFTYNYNAFTGMPTALSRMAFTSLRGGKITDGQVRQLAEGIAGGVPLLTLGYMLRDPDGEVAGSDWYMLKDGRGNEFDARPYFPITPYLLFGEMMHRFQDERPGEVFRFKEAMEGLTGANFRGSGAAGRILEDITAWGLSGEGELQFMSSMKDAGKYLGEAVSGYGQPIYQIADIFVDGDQRIRDYKDDVNYQSGIKNFLGGFAAPFESRLKRVGEAVGFDVDDPWKEDPRFEEVPERVMPFFKILFGATLSRVPPKYVVELNRMGFSYVDLMSKTNSASLDKQMNREIGKALQEEMPEVLATAKEDNFSPERTAAEVKNYISTMKSMIYADLKLGTESNAHHANLQRFRRLSTYIRRAAEKEYIKMKIDKGIPKEDAKIDFMKASDVAEILNIAKNYNNYSKQRQKAK